jgi:exodeoxyribonuclease-3
VLLCGDVNIARTEMDVHPKERKPNTVGQLPEERALFGTLLGTGLTDVGRAADPDNPNLFTLVGTLAQPPRPQHRVAPRLPACVTRGGHPSHRCVVQSDVGTSDHAPVMMTTT